MKVFKKIIYSLLLVFTLSATIYYKSTESKNDNKVYADESIELSTTDYYYNISLNGDNCVGVNCSNCEITLYVISLYNDTYQYDTIYLAEGEPVTLSGYYIYSYEYNNQYNLYLNTSNAFSVSRSSVNMDVIIIFSNQPTLYNENDESVSATLISSSGISILNNLQGYFNFSLPTTYYSESEYLAYGSTQYNAGVSYADSRVNTSSASYTSGYSDGQAEPKLLTLFNAVVSAPATMLTNMFNFSIFGINFTTLIKFLLTIGVIIFAIKVFKRK